MADDSTVLNEYKSQLAAVEQALLNVADDQKTELTELKCKLSEVICMLEGNQELYVQETKNSNKSSGEAATMDAEFEKFQMEIAELEGNSEDVDTESKVSDIDDEVMKLISSLEGSKCRAPFSQQWGEKSYHNAIVFAVDSCERVKTLEDIKVKVMFSNPVCETMKPCPYFLDGYCKFRENKCKYSHGFEVDFLTLREFSLPNYSNLQRDSKCLAKYQNGLWYRAVIESCLDDQQYLIKYDTFGDTDTLDAFNIIPLEETDSAANKVGFESDTNSDDEEYSVERDEQVLNILPINSVSFGEWEQYTKGMGSKLMAKMGYVWGQGLGKNGEGRIEPIEAIILPPGKSLDKCIQLRDEVGPQCPIRVEDRLSIEQDKEQERIKKMKNITTSQHKKTVFDFINSKLAGIKGDAMEGFSKSEKAQPINHKSKASSNKNINFQSFAISEDIKKAQKEINRLQEVLARNRDRNKTIEAQAVQQIDSQNIILKNLQAKEFIIQQEMKLQRSHKKLSIF